MKAAAEIYAPVGGEVTEVNTTLNDDPSLINTDAEGKGWFVKLRVSDTALPAEMMDDAAYAAYVKGLD